MKKNDDGSALKLERVVDLYEGMAIYKVAVELCREQDVNARVMDKETFDRLKSNIEGDKKLESLPFGIIKENPSGNKEFVIISGHHRLRAARSAMMKEVYVMVDETKLTDDEIRSKQLAHNALAGYDDKQVLRQIYDSIANVDDKIKSGIRDADFEGLKFRGVGFDDVKIEFDYTCVKIMFLDSQAQTFDKLVSELMEGDKVYIDDKADFPRFAKTIRELSKSEDIRNIAGLMSRMCEIAEEYLKNKPEVDEEAQRPETKPAGKPDKRKAGKAGK